MQYPKRIFLKTVQNISPYYRQHELRVIGVMFLFLLLFWLFFDRLPAEQLFNGNNENSFICDYNQTIFQKHAYLIIAHKLPFQLKLLLELLDDSRNDIFLLVDKNSEKLFEKDQLRHSLNHSSLFFVSPIRITWSAQSQILAELFLLKEATAIGYQYYHLLSGSDLPLRSQDYIHSFFSNYSGDNYVGYQCKLDKCFRSRLDKYHFFQEYFGHYRSTFVEQMRWLNMHSLTIQDLLGISRLGKDSSFFHKGSNWFSITHCLAKFILTKGTFIRHYFKYSKCGDEEIIQTITAHSPYNSTISPKGIRSIDWKRGTPYVWQNSDYDDLMSSGRLFARKFDMNVDSNIIMRIYHSVKNADTQPPWNNGADH